MLRLCVNDNITNVVHAFADFYSIGASGIDALTRRAEYGMHPGSYLV
jgi:hypothetical protein